MSKLHVLTRLRHRLQSDSAAQPKKLTITRSYLAGAAGLLIIAGLTTAFAAHNTSKTDVNNAQGSSQMTPATETLTQERPEATDPQDSANSSSEDNSISSPGVTNTSNNSVNIHADNSGTSVTVNGQTSTVPADGSMDQSYTTDGSSPSSVHISIDNSSQSTAGSSSRSSHVSVRSQTRTEGRSSSSGETQP